MNFKVNSLILALLTFILTTCSFGKNVQEVSTKILILNNDNPVPDYSVKIYNYFYGESDPSGYLSPEIYNVTTDSFGEINIMFDESAFIQVLTMDTEEAEVLLAKKEVMKREINIAIHLDKLDL